MFDRFAAAPAASDVLARAANALGVDVRDWLRDPEALKRNRVAQPLVGVAQLAAWRAMQEQLPQPEAFAGYSVGELAAHACAGALDAGELSALLDARARIMDLAACGRMGKLVGLRGLDERAVTRLCANREAWPAIVLGDASFVVGGRADAIDALASEASAEGAVVQRLDVDVASHTPLLASAVIPFREALESSPLRDPRVPVAAGVDASLVIRREQAIGALSRQLAEPIVWSRVLQTLHERGCRVFLELPPGNALSRMVRDRYPAVSSRALEDFRSLDGAIGWTLRQLE
jgi:[acyl-carrier-protein] S-malonyltransferase